VRGLNLAQNSSNKVHRVSRGEVDFTTLDIAHHPNYINKGMQVINHYPVRRIMSNKNWIGVLDGPTGSGKSRWALRFCEYVDSLFNQSFNPDYIVFTVEEWMKQFDRSDPGDIIMFDEGEEFSSRRGMDTKNVEFSLILSMVRFTRISTIFTLPSVEMIDKNARRLMHAHLNCLDFDRLSAPRWMATRSGVWWYNIIPKRPTMMDKGGMPYNYKYPRVEDITYSKVWLKDANIELVTQYEQKKRRFFKHRKELAKARIAFMEKKKWGTGNMPHQEKEAKKEERELIQRDQDEHSRCIQTILSH